MNEAQTRAELIDPKLIESGWGVVEGSKILREYHLTLGRIQTGGKRAKPLIADYVLVYKDRKIAVIEAKSDELEVGEGVAQAKNYAEKLYIETTFSSNGKEIYQICMKTGAEGSIDGFPTPDELWNKTFPLKVARGTLFLVSRLKIWVAQKTFAIIRKLRSTIQWLPLPKKNSVSCLPWQPVQARPS